MTTDESTRATLEARRAAGASADPPSRQQSAMDRYLAAESYSTTHAPPRRSARAVPPTAEPQPSPTVIPAAKDATVSAAEERPGGMVVAGIDGSGCARHAARWAAAEAVRRHVPLLLVHAYSLPASGHSGYNPYPPNMLTELREDGNALLHDTAAELRRQHPTLQVSTQQTYGDASTVLRQVSADAALTVVGGHGNGRFAAVALGSVAADIASANPVPVAVIRSGDTPESGPVVVGVDGSPTTEAALAFAFAAAADRGADLLAVHCWVEPGRTGPFATDAAVVVDLDRVKKAEKRLLAGRLAEWIDKYPGVTVRQVLVEGSPASTLLSYAGTAHLIVVGNRGRGGIVGMLLGSTSLTLITHSPVPVVVARPRSTA
jgi:nucleotide-binding universal stress UspA family protein